MTKKQKFFQLIEAKKIKFITASTREANLLMGVKKLTEHIDYECNFKDGRCKKFKELSHMQNSGIYKFGCCCGECAVRFGYLNEIYIEHLNEYADAWDADTGFFKPGRGCMLPRRLRSSMCLRVCCQDYRRSSSKPLDDAVRQLLYHYY